MKKTIFKVAELPHAFINGIAVNGATAGVSASVDNNALWHCGGKPAAAFIQNLRAPCLAIFPQWHDNGARWSPTAIRAATPSTFNNVVIERWPSDYSAWESFTVDNLFRVFMHAVSIDCRATIHNVDDTMGDKAGKLPAYCATINALLALPWADGKARLAATRAWRKLRDYWSIANNGAFELSTVRAIAQHDAIAAQAKTASGPLNAYFRLRTSVHTMRQRLDLTKRTTLSTLTDAITKVMRAGMTAPQRALYTDNPFALITSDYSSVKRIADWQMFPGFIAYAWHEAIRGETPARINMESSNRDWPKRYKTQAAEVLKYAARRAERERTKREIRAAEDGLRNGRDCMHMLDALNDSTPFAERWNVIDAYIKRFDLNFRYYQNAPARIADWLREKYPKHPLLREYADVLAESRIESVTAQRDALLAEKQTRERLDRIAEFETEVNRCVALAESGKPRAALALLRAHKYQLTVFDASRRYGEHLARLRAQIETVDTRIGQLIETISPLQEWNNGGTTAPGPGDWLRVVGDKCRTTRSVTVTTRAVRVAMAWLAKQAPGACVAGFDIDGYRFAGRSADGSVTVGCHHFSSEAVANIMEQLQA